MSTSREPNGVKTNFFPGPGCLSCCCCAACRAVPLRVTIDKISNSATQCWVLFMNSLIGDRGPTRYRMVYTSNALYLGQESGGAAAWTVVVAASLHWSQSKPTAQTQSLRPLTD